jgi:hypothetical protein
MKLFNKPKDRLDILWTSADKDVALNMVFMYALNSKKHGWWKEVNLIVWGPSTYLAANDPQIQAEIMEMTHQGLTIEACQQCSENYGVAGKLSKLDITVRYMGEPLTQYLKSGHKIITF